MADESISDRCIYAKMQPDSSKGVCILDKEMSIYILGTDLKSVTQEALQHKFWHFPSDTVFLYKKRLSFNF